MYSKYNHLALLYSSFSYSASIAVAVNIIVNDAGYVGSLNSIVSLIEVYSASARTRLRYLWFQPHRSIYAELVFACNSIFNIFKPLYVDTSLIGAGILNLKFEVL